MKKYTNQLCFYCKTRLTEEDLAVSCDACGTPHHLSCWQRDGHCAACGSPSSAEATAYMNAPAAPNYVQAPTFAPAAPSTQEVISAITDRVFYTDLPLVLENTELVMDRGQGYLFARCTFRSLSVNPIKALMLTFYCRDVWGNAIEQPVCHQYLDLRAGYNDSFGGDQPLLIPDASTRSIQVSVTKVLLMDDTVLECTGVAFTAPAPAPLTQKLQGEELLAQYRRDTTPKAQYVPAEMGPFWCCTCGALHSDASVPCSVCGCTKEQLAAALDVDALTEKANAFREEQLRKARAARVLEEERRRIQEEETRRRIRQSEMMREEIATVEKGKKIRIFVWIAVVVAVVAIILISVVGAPYRDYDEACEYMGRGQYWEALEIFCELEDFQDSEAMAAACVLAIVDEGFEEDTDLSRLDDYDFTLRSSHYATLYDKVWTQINTHTDYGYWINSPDNVNVNNMLMVLRMLPDGYESRDVLIQLFEDIYDSDMADWNGGDYIRNNRAFLETVWPIDFVQDYLLADGQITYFMEGYWENSTGNYYFEFYKNDNGGTNCRYNLPHKQPSGTKYYDVVDQIYVYLDKDSEELSKGFKYTFTDYDTVSVYCYSNGSTYTLYRD